MTDPSINVMRVRGYTMKWDLCLVILNSDRSSVSLMGMWAYRNGEARLSPLLFIGINDEQCMKQFFCILYFQSICAICWKANLTHGDECMVLNRRRFLQVSAATLLPAAITSLAYNYPAPGVAHAETTDEGKMMMFLGYI